MNGSLEARVVKQLNTTIMQWAIDNIEGLTVDQVISLEEFLNRRVWPTVKREMEFVIIEKVVDQLVGEMLHLVRQEQEGDAEWTS